MKKTIFLLIIFLLLLLNPIDSVFAYGWGYQKNNDHEVPYIGQYERVIENTYTYYADLSGEKVVYLTFDNGYEEGYTETVLNILQEHNVPATFFVTGHYVKSEPALIKRMVDEGHIIGNHSYHHPDFTKLSKQKMEDELRLVEEQVEKVSSQDTLTYLRPPRGTFNEQTLKWANEFGYINVFWSLAFADWKTDAQKGWKYAYDQIMEQIHPGAIILLHTVSSDNAEALSKVIEQLKREDYEFRSLDELIFTDLLMN